MINTLTINPKQRVLLVSDIHGEPEKLMMRLREAQFNFEKDICISLGDLIDKGRNSLGALRLTKKKWMRFVLGNHEEAALTYFDSQCPWAGKDWQEQGGDWYFNLKEQEKTEAATLLSELRASSSRVLEILMFNKRFIGTHADLAIDDWDFDTVTKLAKEPDFTKCRKLARTIKDGQSGSIKRLNGVEAIFCGHTSFPKTLSFENRHWLDTGACQANSTIGLAEITKDKIIYH